MQREESAIPATNEQPAQLSVTILIPAAYLSLFQRRLNRSGVRPGVYFGYVVQQASRMCASPAASARLRVRALYQRRGLNLVRFHLRVDASIWFELSLLARNAGESRCRYFWQLAFLDCIHEGANSKAPGEDPSFCILWSIILTESVSYRTGFLERRLEIRPPPWLQAN